MRALIRRIWQWLIGAAPNADGSFLAEIGDARSQLMTEIALMMGAAPRSFRIVPNKGDVTVEDVAKSIGGSAVSDGFVGLSPYASEPGNPLAFTLTPEAPTPPGVPSILAYTFDSATEPGVTQPVVGSVAVTVLPENATDAEVVEIV